MNLKEKQLKSTLVYKGKILEFYNDQVLCPNNNIAYREYVKHRGASKVLAVVDGKIIMERQYRYAVDEIIYELPAGKLEENEDPAECAIRELEEETGYKARSIHSLGKIYSTCAFSNESVYLFYTDDVEKTETKFDEDEFLEIEYFTLAEVREMISSGRIVDSTTICAIYKYELIKK